MRKSVQASITLDSSCCSFDCLFTREECVCRNVSCELCSTTPCSICAYDGCPVDPGLPICTSATTDPPTNTSIGKITLPLEYTLDLSCVFSGSRRESQRLILTDLSRVKWLVLQLECAIHTIDKKSTAAESKYFISWPHVYCPTLIG